MNTRPEFDFTTNVEVEIDTDSQLPPGFIYDSRFSNAKVNYRLYLDLKTTGISGVGFIAPDQEIIFSLELIKDGQEDTETYDFKVKICNLEVEADKIVFNEGEIEPEDIVIELKNIRQVDSNNFEAEADGILIFA
jgi:hypothetical protein